MAERFLAFLLLRLPETQRGIGCIFLLAQYTFFLV
jgi:hypothetical protein